MGANTTGRRPSLEECIRISTADLKANGQLETRGAVQGTYTWQQGKRQLAALTIIVDTSIHEPEPRITLQGTAHGNHIYQSIRMEPQAMRFGGQRWFFLCPVTGRRCTKLVLEPGKNAFTSRMASGLPNASQRMNALDRSLRRISKLQSKIGLMSNNTHKSTRKKVQAKLQGESDRHLSILNEEAGALASAAERSRARNHRR